jgi:hypothetical protein
MRVLLPTDSFCNELKWLSYTPLLPKDFILLTISSGTLHDGQNQSTPPKDFILLMISLYSFDDL